jgi:hypothetical protein
MVNQKIPLCNYHLGMVLVILFTIIHVYYTPCNVGMSQNTEIWKGKPGRGLLSWGRYTGKQLIFLGQVYR